MPLAQMPLTIEEPEPRPHLGRVRLLLGATVLLLVVLGGRLWHLQVTRFVRYERLASANRVRHEPIDAPRGGIFDRRGTLLAGSRLATQVAILDLADPRQLRRGLSVGSGLGWEALAALPQPPVAEQLHELARLLPLETTAVAAVTAALADPQRPRFAPVVVQEEVPAAAVCRIEERLWRLPNVVLTKVPRRQYPQGSAVSHVLGYVGSISPNQLLDRRQRMDEQIRGLSQQIEFARRTFADERLPEVQALIDRLGILRRLRNQAACTVGKTGLEAQYEDLLKGEPGILTWQVNARNEPLKLVNVSAGQAGCQLVLNVDLELQRLARSRFAGRRGSLAMLDVRDGAVLALFGSPSYDNNLFIPRIKPADWQAILENPAHPLQNRAIRNAFPPGSTFKMVTAAAGLADRSLTDHTWASCGGGRRIGPSFKRCWSTHGGVDLTAAIAVSCDTFFYGVGLALGPEKLLRGAAQFGVGEATGIDLPNEAHGRLPTLAWHRRVHEREWYPGDTANISIGQGDIACTTLQMAVITAAVANGGTLWQPRLLREVRDRQGQLRQGWKGTAGRRVNLRPQDWQRIRSGMRAAVTSGTAGLAALPQVAVAGKTGSAEDPPRLLPHAWFVCFAPYDAPEVAVAVMVENAGHGGENSAPIARALLEQYFRGRGVTP
ncbi:MAG: penicillin-binding protein 2 [Fimbriimonadaceae bacterium]|nr:penicillin-binding protein 2 [Fimbriimonadaceae bacterium]